MRLLLLYFLFLPFILIGQVLPERPASALNKVILYSDSTFFVHSNIYYEEGTLFEVIGETRFEYEDEAQNQKFKWYQVKTPDGKVGWIYGDGLAVVVSDREIDPLLESYHLRSFNFSEDLNQATTWVASIEGKDNFHQEDYLNPLYKEFYLVVTSQLGKSFHIQVSGESAMGSSQLRQFNIQDLTGDAVPEILLLRGNLNSGSTFENKHLEIYTFQAGSINKVFEERMNFPSRTSVAPPSLSKFVEINKKTIRVAYLDFLPCVDYSLSLQPNEEDIEKESCMEYVTYSYLWDDQSKAYTALYEESRTWVEGQLKLDKGFLRDKPSYLSGINEKLAPKSRLKIIQAFQKSITQRGQQKIVPYLYVQSERGNYGYIHAKDVQFINNEYSFLLTHYYQNIATDKNATPRDSTFLIIKMEDEQMIISKNE